MNTLKRIKRRLREHRLVLGIAALVVLVAFTGWQRLTVDSRQRVLPAGDLGGADYTLSHFTLTLINEHGAPGMKLSAEAMRHDPALQRGRYREPRVVLFEAGRPRWHGRADTGWVNDQRSEIALMGSVVLNRAETAPAGPLTLRTPRVHLFPREDRAVSEAEVEFTQPGALLTGTGMALDFENEVYRIHSNVHGRFHVAN